MRVPFSGSPSFAIRWVAALSLSVSPCAAAAQDPPPGTEKTPEPLHVTLERPTPEGIALTADHYAVRAEGTAPVVVALHMEGSSRGEFRAIAETFLEFPCSVLAVDLRVGKEAHGVPNATTAAYEKARPEPAAPADAYADVVEAVKWARELHPGSKVVLLGSGFSAALALVHAAREPAAVDAVLAFSPGELIEGWTVAAEARKIQVPVYVSCGNGLEEKSKATRIFNALDKKLRASFYPPDGIVAPRGAASLEQSDQGAHQRVWSGVYTLLKPLCPPAAPAPPRAPPEKDG